MLLLLACAPRHALPDRDSATFTDADGTSGRYRLVVPDGVGEHGPPGALLFFHWDGGAPAYARQAAPRAELAAAHDLVVVSIQAPGRGCWWSPDVSGYARWVDALVRERLVRDRGVDPGRIFLTGLSGGADFAATFPFHSGFAWGGGVVALCGGDVPRLDGGDCATEASPPAAPLPASLPDPARAVRYDFALAAGDELLPASLAAAELWRGLGVTHVRHRVVPGEGHCGFADGFAGLRELAEGLDYVDPRVTP